MTTAVPPTRDVNTRVVVHPGPDPGPVMPKVPVNSPELNQVSKVSQLRGFQEKIMVHLAWSWLVDTYRHGDE